MEAVHIISNLILHQLWVCRLYKYKLHYKCCIIFTQIAKRCFLEGASVIQLNRIVIIVSFVHAKRYFVMEIGAIQLNHVIIVVLHFTQMSMKMEPDRKTSWWIKP